MFRKAARSVWSTSTTTAYRWRLRNMIREAAGSTFDPFGFARVTSSRSGTRILNPCPHTWLKLTSGARVRDREGVARAEYNRRELVRLSPVIPSGTRDAPTLVSMLDAEGSLAPHDVAQ